MSWNTSSLSIQAGLPGLRSQTPASAYIHIAVITPTAIVIISTLMLMVLKRMRLWISAIIFILGAIKTIRQIKDRDEFLLFLRERYLNSSSQSKKSSKANGSQGVHARPDQAKTRKTQDRSKPWAHLETIAWRQQHACIVSFIIFDANKDSKKVQLLWIHVSSEILNNSTKARMRSNECSQLAINNISMKSPRNQGPRDNTIMCL